MALRGKTTGGQGGSTSGEVRSTDNVQAMAINDILRFGDTYAGLLALIPALREWGSIEEAIAGAKARLTQVEGEIQKGQATLVDQEKEISRVKSEADSLYRASRVDADTVTAKARLEADRIMSEAKDIANKMVGEARDKHESLAAKADTTKNKLEMVEAELKTKTEELNNITDQVKRVREKLAEI